MLRAGGAQLGQRRGAISDAQRAARLKRTAGWERGERRHCAGNWLELVAHELRRSPQEARSIGMPRVFEHFSRRAFFHAASRICDGDAIGHLRDDAEVMRDKEKRESEIAPAPREQL